MGKKNKFVKILCPVVSAVMMSTVVAGCANSANTASVDEKEAELSSTVLRTDIDHVSAPDEGTEVTQALKLKSSSKINGTLSADDIKLGGSFKNMKVTDVSNDEGTIAFTVSGVPEFEGASTLGYLGTMEFAGKYFDSEKNVSASIPVMCKSGKAAEGSYFYPFFDSVIDNGDSKELHIFLRPYGGSFTEGFNKDKITLDGVLGGAQIASLKKADKEYELVVNVKELPKDQSGENAYGTITLAAGSLTNNNEEISYTREYSADTLGRALTAADMAKIKETVYPKKDHPEMYENSDEIGNLFVFGSQMASYYGTAMTAYSTVTAMLGAFGILGSSGPSAEERRHQEIMEALSTISGQIEAMQADVTAIRSYAVDNKRALEDLSLITVEDYLAQFHSHYDVMVKYTNEIATALTRNSEAIQALADEYYDENEEGREMSEAERNRILEEFGGKICNMRQSNYYTIGEKLKLLDHEYSTAMTYLKKDNANPISRYCQMYQYIDNFSTTSLTDKELYALDLDCQFDRTLSYLMLLGGKDSQDENVGLFKDSYFPDVVEEATNKNGDPYCYLMKSNVRISDSTKYYKDGKVDYWILQDEDIDEFAKRKKGGSLKDELVLAGFDADSFLNQRTTFNKSDFGSGAGYTDNDRFYGLSFAFKASYGNQPNTLSIDTWYGRMDGMFNYMKDDRNSFVVNGTGFYYENSPYNGQKKVLPGAGYISKGGSHYTAGWYMIEPMAYLQKV